MCGMNDHGRTCDGYLVLLAKSGLTSSQPSAMTAGTSEGWLMKRLGKKGAAQCVDGWW
jgi:hypothetical protein